MRLRMGSVLLAALLLLALPACGQNVKGTYRIATDTKHPLSVRAISGAASGEKIYIVAGIHGDEEAGHRAAERIAEERILSGTLYLLSPANPFGAERGLRTMSDGSDLNRNFPGGSGFDTEKTAAAIYRDIAEKQPALVLDLHEAEGRSAGDDLRESIIVSDVSLCADLVWALLNAPETGALPGASLTLYGSPPAGSLNQAVTEGLCIPVITVETDQNAPLDERIEMQLRIAEYVLAFYGMRDGGEGEA